jgi:hypothetical protein
VQVHLLELAHLAASHRRTDLAEHIQFLARYRRSAGAATIADEMQLAVVAAAVHEAVDAWRQFLGSWVRDIALKTTIDTNAHMLEGWIDTLCAIDPPLRTTLGRAKARLRLITES